MYSQCADGHEVCEPVKCSVCNFVISECSEDYIGDGICIPCHVHSIGDMDREECGCSDCEEDELEEMAERAESLRKRLKPEHCQEIEADMRQAVSLPFEEYLGFLGSYSAKWTRAVYEYDAPPELVRGWLSEYADIQLELAKQGY